MADQHTRPHDDDLARIEQLLRELTPDDLAPVAPPARVWEAIATELDGIVDDDSASGPLAGEQGTDAPARVVSLDARRRAPTSWLLAVAAAAIVVIAGAVVVTRSGDGAEVLATAALRFEPEAFDPLGVSATAQAELVERDGSYELVLGDASLPTDLGEPADLELWLIEADTDGNIVDIAPIALVDGNGTYVVPSDVDVTTHRIVDISIEPRDGDATHSSRSILRGTLADV